MTTEHNDLPLEAKSNGFTPMTEAEMANIKGGTDLPDWLEDLIEQVGNLLDSLGNPDVDSETDENDFWDEYNDELNEMGLTHSADI